MTAITAIRFSTLFSKSKKFPDTVKFLTGAAFAPSAIRNPLADREKSPVTALAPACRPVSSGPAAALLLPVLLIA